MSLIDDTAHPSADTAHQQLGERIAKAVLDIDHFSASLVRELARSKAAVVRTSALDLASQAQAIRLAISMELAGARLLALCQDFGRTAAHLRLICAKTRVSQDGKLVLELILRQQALLCIDLERWDGNESKVSESIDAATRS